VAAFGVAATLLAGLLTATVPALRTSRLRAAGARGGVGGGRGLPGAVMVGAEVALAVTLLVGGGLLLRSFLATVSRDLGFDPERVITLDVALTGPAYADPERSLAYWETLVERERAVPGVAAVAVSSAVPTAQAGVSFIEIEGDDRANEGAGYRAVSDDYFEVLGTPLLAGRNFDARDAAGTERVGIVSESFARAFWPEREAVGRRFKATSMEAYFSGGRAPWIRIVGVVGDVRQYGFESTVRPDVFVLHRQIPAWTRSMSAVVKLRPGAGAGTAEELRRTAHGVDPDLAVRARPLGDRVRGLLAGRRLTLAIVGTFAAAGTLLVCLGVYGLISFAVQERTREIAVRAALGLDRSGILTLLLGSALRVALVGVAGGALAALVFSRLVDSLVVDVGTADPLTYAAAAVLLLGVALLAALVPALRATRLDPLEALSAE
jgi:predicted permease